MNAEPQDDSPPKEIEEPEFGHSADLVLITDPYGMFLKVSENSKEFLGYDHEEMEGRLATDFIHPVDLPDTRDETRLIRRYRRARHFYCRYLPKNRNARPVELLWTGMWDEQNGTYIFCGRLPQGTDRLPLVHRLDVLDGWQISKGLFALSLILAWCFDLGNNSTYEVRRIVDELNGATVNWVEFMSAYTAACLACLFWKQRWFQFFVSIVSIMIWTWMGFVTLVAPHYVAAAGIYEVILGLGSICVLYYRGRQL